MPTADVFLLMIVGGFYSVTALRENDQERVTVDTEHRKLHPCWISVRGSRSREFVSKRKGRINLSRGRRANSGSAAIEARKPEERSHKFRTLAN